jgi:hypothetical protein
VAEVAASAACTVATEAADWAVLAAATAVSFASMVIAASLDASLVASVDPPGPLYIPMILPCLPRFYLIYVSFL